MGKEWIRLTRNCVPLLALFLNACGPLAGDGAKDLGKKTSDELNCPAEKSLRYSALYDLVQEGKSLPSVAQVESAVSDALEQKATRGKLQASSESTNSFVTHYTKFYEIVKAELEAADSLADQQRILAEMELEDRSTSKKAELQAKLQPVLAALDKASESLNADCELPIEPGPQPTPVPGSYLESLKASMPAPVYGGMKTFAVAYQSCEVLNLEPMSASSPSVKGVEIDKRHPSGSGWIRKIASVTDVNRTHNYIKGQTQPSSSCFKVSESPLIYDFGGKPYATSALDSSFDLFRNAGSGGSHLGIDCSGYVFAAYASAGLKFKSSTHKASLVSGIGTSSLRNVKSSGLNCLKEVEGDLAAGDMIVINGHVVMVNEINEDPFAVSGFRSVGECSNVKSENFQFVISQSSPSKGGIGINRMYAADYLAGSSTMRSGLLAHARKACERRFGFNKALINSNVTVLRHKGTPECIGPELAIERESCLSSCPLAALP